MPYKDKEKQKEATRRSYEKNKDQINSRSWQRKNKARRWLLEYKENIECEKCGFNHPAALEFHHRDPSTKLYGITNMPRDCPNIEKMIEEISKCDVLCANCHAILHWEEHHGSLV